MKTSVKKEMKKLSRADLLEIIYEMKKNEENLQSMLTTAQDELKKREIMIDNAGSIAEASLALNDVFGAAQRAVDTYVTSIQAHYASMEEKCAEAEAERQKLLDAAQIQADKIVKEAEQKSSKMIEAAKSNIKGREEKFQQTVDRVLNSNSELRALLK